MPFVAFCQVMSDSKGAGEQAAAMMNQLHGLRNLLLSPPLDNPRNVVDYSMYLARHEVRKGYACSWVIRQVCRHYCCCCCSC